jgi:hypothetical protein
MTINGNARYGSICGGIATLICTGFIIWCVYYFAGIYIRQDSYYSTRDVVRVDLDKGQIFSQNLTTGQNFRAAIGFVDGTLPDLQNVSAQFEGTSPVFKIIGVQAQIDRTIRDSPIYTEQIYNLLKCPFNYLNDGNRFLYQGFGIQ